MPERNIVRATMDELPSVSQKLRLRCRQCGTRASYDVGTIFWDQDPENESSEVTYTFTNYFRCRKCAGPGPWDVDDRWKLSALALRAKLQGSFNGFSPGRCTLFDGTFIQTPAIGEEHLLKLIKAAPHKAFLHTRLGNLFRSSGQPSQSKTWYDKSLALDPGDIEARFHLFRYACDAEDVPAALVHTKLLVRYLLEGRKTDKEDLTKGMAFYVVDELREAPEQFRQHFLGRQPDRSDPKEVVFIRTLLSQQGTEEDIRQAAADRLLEGKPLPQSPASGSGSTGDSTASDNSDPADFDLIPSLADLVRTVGLDPEKLAVAFETDGQKRIRITDKHSVAVSDGQKMTRWGVPSLAQLFRGNRIPPADIDHYPPDYAPLFFFIESQLLTVCDARGDLSDQELEELYSALRRRPDGRSLGVVHDVLWQVAALLLGCHSLSEAEFTAILGALVRSTRKWALRPVSRNYIAYLRKTFSEVHSGSLRRL